MFKCTLILLLDTNTHLLTLILSVYSIYIKLLYIIQIFQDFISITVPIRGLKSFNIISFIYYQETFE